MLRTPATIVRVVDGDTVDVSIDGRTERVRLIGIDTPETVDPSKPVQCFGRGASDRAKALLPVGASMELEADPSQGERDSTPQRRLLPYIWTADGRHFNKQMIEEGCAHEYTFRTPYKYQAEFKQAEREASEQQRGLWAANTCAGDTERPAPVARAATATAPGPTATLDPLHSALRQSATSQAATAQAQPAPTSTPQAAAAPVSTPAPVTRPSSAAPLTVAFESVQGAGPNRQARVTVRVDPPRAGVQCSIRYFTPAGTQSEAGGLGTKPTDQAGRASWSWTIGGRTGAGTGSVRVKCDGAEEVSAPIDIS